MPSSRVPAGRARGHRGVVGRAPAGHRIHWLPRGWRVGRMPMRCQPTRVAIDLGGSVKTPVLLVVHLRHPLLSWGLVAQGALVRAVRAGSHKQLLSADWPAAQPRRARGPIHQQHRLDGRGPGTGAVEACPRPRRRRPQHQVARSTWGKRSARKYSAGVVHRGSPLLPAALMTLVLPTPRRKAIRAQSVTASLGFGGRRSCILPHRYRRGAACRAQRRAPTSYLYLCSSSSLGFIDEYEKMRTATRKCANSKT